MSARRIALLVLALVLLDFASYGVPLAHAQSVEERVEKGVGEFQDLEFAAAITTLEAVLKLGAATQSQKLMALELIAISHLSLGKVDKSRDAFRRLLTLSPDYVLRSHDGSPKVQSVFDEVRASMKKQGTGESKTGDGSGSQEAVESKTTELRPGRNKPARAGRRFEISVQSRGPAPQEVVLYWRTDPAAAYQTQAMRRGKSAWLTKLALPASTSDYSLQYYVVAKGVAAQSVASLGQEQSPLELAVASSSSAGGRSEGGSWYTAWPLWAGVGIALAGGSALLISSGSDPQQGALSPGRITLTP